ncbi:hypothetical protein FOTG_15770 [Fusarium oxysporum f. sp. vasinfectum 25433]|uniref:Uncharacterized protein n=1 Tax=Fusarium oxysporum f. sp. vasinfectum 25433 TaxID=1089449 RepID=X0KQN6_FUSOX|nr:hypothetical protein FOTG_15770 [Fusarium oxysporum f. sp. vasinfectum 25433]
MSHSPLGGAERGEVSLTEPDRRRVYLTPKQMRQNLIRLFDAQWESGRRIHLKSVRFYPQKVTYTLGNVLSPETVDEPIRLWCFYCDTLEAGLQQVADCRRRGMQGMPENALVLDPRDLIDVYRQQSGEICWNSPKDVRQRILSIKTVLLREECDRYKFQRTGIGGIVKVVD